MGKQLLFGISVYDGSDLININEYAFYDFENRNIVRDNRPADTWPPDYQDVTVPIVLEGKDYFVKLRIIYTINQFYDPNSVAAQNINCPGSATPFDYYFLVCLNPYVLVGALFLFVLAVAVIIRRKSKRKSKESDGISK